MDLTSLRRCALTGVCAWALVPWAARAADSLRLASSAIVPNGTVGTAYVYHGFGCRGRNLSPPLKWSGAPEGTQSYALTVYDPDAPTGSGWWHWVVYDIPTSVTELAEGASASLPAGALQGHTDYGSAAYGGPCPPPGDKPHRYVFTLYALKVAKLNVPPQATAAMIGFAINADKIAEASFTAYYGR